MLAFIFPLILLFSAPERHPFFVSVIEAEYFNKENLIGISCKVYNDDLENVLKKESGTAVDILGGDKDTNLKKLKPYFQKHLQVKVNNRLMSMDVLGYETEKEATFIFLELKETGDPRKFEITTDLLYERDQSQVNLVHFIRNGQRLSQRLTYPKTQASFEAP
jgi:hypothetical protein